MLCNCVKFKLVTFLQPTVRFDLKFAHHWFGNVYMFTIQQRKLVNIYQ